MDREKQIEEMAEAIFQNCNCGLFFSEAEKIARFVIEEQGYVKQSEGEWKQAYNSSPHYVCTHCNHLYNNKSFKYCPNCGAKMKRR